MKPILSICMMVKNESANLRRCLESLKLLRTAVNSELIIIDTGSTDNTSDIAREYTDKVFFQQWNDHFSEMRNKTIQYAEGQWLLIIDADEELVQWEGLVSFLRKKHSKEIGGAAFLVKNLTSKIRYVAMTSMRVFRNDGQFHYEGAVHNTPVFKGNIVAIDATLIHYGYLSDDQELMERKFKRTRILLQRELENDPSNIYYRFQLAVSYAMHEDWYKSFEEIKVAYETMKSKALDARQYLYIYYQYAQACLKTANYKKTEEICLEGIQLESEYIDLYFYLAQAQAILEKYDVAISNYEKYLTLVDSFDTLQIRYNPALNHHTLCGKPEALYNLAVMYRKQENYSKAFTLITKVVMEYDSISEEQLRLLVDLSFHIEDFSCLQKVYLNLRNSKKDNLISFLTMTMESRKNIQHSSYEPFVTAFSKLEDNYGTLNALRQVHLANADIAILLRSKIAAWNFNALPEYYGEAFYYSIPYSDIIKNITLQISDGTAVRLLQYLDQFYKFPLVDLIKKNIPYSEGSFIALKVNKILLKYVLFSGILNEDEYSRYFKAYIDNGVGYVKYLYNQDFINQELIYDVKNREEALFIYAALAYDNYQDKLCYIEYLKKALDIYPEMNKGISFLLTDMSEVNDDDLMKDLLGQLFVQINLLVQEGNFTDALKVIEESEQIIGKDTKLLLKKTEVYRKQHENALQ